MAGVDKAKLKRTGTTDSDAAVDPAKSTIDRRDAAARQKAAAERTATLDRDKVSSGLASGLAAKGGGEGMPKQADYGSTSAWSSAVREWRASKRGVTMDNAAGALAKRLEK